MRQFIYFFPQRHIDYSRTVLISDLEVGAVQTIVATIWEARVKATAKRWRATEAIVGDESGNISVVWFNQPYLAKKLTPNSRVVISGRVEKFRNRKVFQSPEWEPLESDNLTHTGRLIPVYPLTAGLSPRVVRKLAKGTIDRWLPRLPDFLPGGIRKAAGLLPLSEAIRQAHYPDSELKKDQARKRLAFDELFLIQLSVLSKKRDWQQEGTGNAFEVDSHYLERFLNSLPFTMTTAQKRALVEIQEDLGKSKPMSRLLQGDVGSGKTVVATAAMLLAAANGYQAALMAPTEILAEQHYDSICNLINRASGEAGDGKPIRNHDSMLPPPNQCWPPHRWPQRKLEARGPRAHFFGGNQHHHRHSCPYPERGRIPSARALRGRRAAALRGDAAFRAKLKGSESSCPGDERHPYPPYPGTHPLR